MKQLLIFIFLCMTYGVHADIAVVVGKNSSVNNIDEREVSNIFLSKTRFLHNGTKVKAFELNNELIKKEFYKAIANKSPSQINSYWTTLIFTGKGRPPRKVQEINRLIQVLNDTPNAIAYLPQEKVTDSMRVVHTIHCCDYKESN
jgi:hypothetical protein